MCWMSAVGGFANNACASLHKVQSSSAAASDKSPRGESVLNEFPCGDPPCDEKVAATVAAAAPPPPTAPTAAVAAAAAEAAAVAAEAAASDESPPGESVLDKFPSA